MTSHNPKFKSRQQRINVTLIRRYRDGWSTEEIADYVGVRRETVSRYLNSPAAEQVESLLAEEAASVRLELAMDYMERLEDLKELEARLLQETRAAPVAYDMVDVEGEVVPQEGSMPTEAGGPIESLPKPVVAEWREVPKVSKDLKRIWEEIDSYTEKVEDLLGLEAPDRHHVESERHETSVEAKVLRIESPDNYPEQPVYDAEEAP